MDQQWWMRLCCYILYLSLGEDAPWCVWVSCGRLIDGICQAVSPSHKSDTARMSIIVSNRGWYWFKTSVESARKLVVITYHCLLYNLWTQHFPFYLSPTNLTLLYPLHRRSLFVVFVPRRMWFFVQWLRFVFFFFLRFRCTERCNISLV